MRCFSKNAALSLVAFLLVMLKAGQAQHLRAGDTKATEGTCACACLSVVAALPFPSRLGGVVVSVCGGSFAFPLSLGWGGR